MIGEGPERERLQETAQSLGVTDRVEFVGGLPLDKVLDYYAASDVLVLTSQTEGWPKVVAEAMAFGLVCVASNTGFVSEMLSDGRGVLVPPGDVNSVIAALRRIIVDPAAFEPVRARAAAWSGRYSLEGLRDALRDLLTERWGEVLEPRTITAGMGASK